MTAVTLPTAVAQAQARVRILDWGGELVPSLGGPVQRIDRLGTRHAVDFVLPPIGSAVAAMQWCQRLKRAKSLGALMKFPQVGFTSAAGGSPSITGGHSAGATAINIFGMSGSYTEGQYVSIIHNGRRYLYSFDASGSTMSNVAISPMLRTALSNGDTIELAAMIEGLLGGDELGWNIDAARMYGLSFTITETE